MLPPSLKGHSWFSCTSMPIQWRGGQGKGKGFFQLYLGGGFKYFLFSPRKLGKMNPFWLLLFKGVGSTTNYRYKLYIYMIFPFYYWHLGRLYISYSLGAWSPPHWNVPRHPFLASNFCSASVSAGRWRKNPVIAGGFTSGPTKVMEFQVRYGNTWGMWVLSFDWSL